jgi:hypothetical protein
MVLTFALLGVAFFKTYKGRKKTGPWSIGVLYGTTILSVGLVAYALIFK